MSLPNGEVSRGSWFSFTLDHCQGCKGIWLDRNEWEALKARNLHDDVNSMLTAFWQDEAQKAVRKKRMEQIYVGRFGQEDYSEIERIRAWLGTRQNKQDLLAFLYNVSSVVYGYATFASSELKYDQPKIIVLPTLNDSSSIVQPKSCYSACKCRRRSCVG